MLISRRRSLPILIVAIIINLVLLAYFKYTLFIATNIDYLLTPAIVGHAQAIILPIGISFYTFQGLSYVIDVWRRDAAPERNFVVFSAYLSFFPQLIAGPIVRYADVARDFHAPAISFGLFSAGASRFLIGLFKKVVVADSVAPVVDAAFASSTPTFLDAWLGALAYSVQIYFDFSGYSDMAIGLGMIFGIRCLGLIVQKRCRPGVVANRPGGHEEARRATIGIGHGMKLGVRAAFGAADQATEIEALNSRLRRAIRARGHFLSDGAAMKLLPRLEQGREGGGR